MVRVCPFKVFPTISCVAISHILIVVTAWDGDIIFVPSGLKAKNLMLWSRTSMSFPICIPVVASNILMLADCAVTILFPLGLKNARCVLYLSSGFPICFPVVTSHILIVLSYDIVVLSSDIDMIFVPSGLKEADLTMPVWPINGCPICSPVSKSHILIDASLDANTICFPSGLKGMDLMKLVYPPDRCPISFPVVASHISPHPDTMRFPSGQKEADMLFPCKGCPICFPVIASHILMVSFQSVDTIFVPSGLKKADWTGHVCSNTPI